LGLSDASTIENRGFLRHDSHVGTNIAAMLTCERRGAVSRLL
jgi:hypothetical protein